MVALVSQQRFHTLYVRKAKDEHSLIVVSNFDEMCVFDSFLIKIWQT